MASLFTPQMLFVYITSTTISHPEVPVAFKIVLTMLMQFLSCLYAMVSELSLPSIFTL